MPALAEGHLVSQQKTGNRGAFESWKNVDGAERAAGGFFLTKLCDLGELLSDALYRTAMRIVRPIQ